MTATVLQVYFKNVFLSSKFRFFCNKKKKIMYQASFHTLDLDASGGPAGWRGSQSSSLPVQTWMSVRRGLTAAERDKSVTTSPAATAVTARQATSTTPFAKSARVRMECAGCDAGGCWVEAWWWSSQIFSHAARNAVHAGFCLQLKCDRSNVCFTFSEPWNIFSHPK